MVQCVRACVCVCGGRGRRRGWEGTEGKEKAEGWEKGKRANRKKPVSTVKECSTKSEKMMEERVIVRVSRK